MIFINNFIFLEVLRYLRQKSFLTEKYYRNKIDETCNRKLIIFLEIWDLYQILSY